MEKLWQLIGGALSLNTEAFTQKSLYGRSAIWLARFSPRS